MYWAAGPLVLAGPFYAGCSPGSFTKKKGRKSCKGVLWGCCNIDMISAVARSLVQDALSGQKDFRLDTITIPAHFKWWAKMGYSARGAIYLVIGGLAVMTAAGAGGEITDTRGAILTI